MVIGNCYSDYSSLCSNYNAEAHWNWLPKQRSDDRTTNLSRLIIFDNLRIDLFGWLRCVALKMCGGETRES